MSYVSIEKAVELLKQDQVVAVPTETVYGLAGRLGSEVALKKIFEVKGRPLFDPLIVHVENRLAAQRLSSAWPMAISALTDAFWPGPLTVVVPKNANVPDLITAGLETVGLRCPSHPLAQEVLHRLGEPFAAPSANRFGKTSPTRAEHVATEYSGQVQVLEGGASEVGLESTVVTWNDRLQRIEVLRPGAISRAEMSEQLKAKGLPSEITIKPSVASPGHLENHYEPDIPLVLVQRQLWTEALQRKLAQDLNITAESWLHLRLDKNPVVAARELYDQLRRLARSGQNHGIVWFFENENQDPKWEAIWDRLKRAAKSVFLDSES